MNIGKISKQNIGNAGEFYLASILSAKNFVVTVTLGRNEGYDLLAVNPKGKAVKISVKARNMKDIKRFPINSRCENISSDDLFYAFVRLNEFQKEPDFWIVPSKIVCNVIKNSHAKWMATPNKKGGKHNDGDLRNFWLIQDKHYPKNWDKTLKKYYKNINIIENF